MRSLTRPNVLILYTDQQRLDTLGCYGNELAKTLHLDRLAARGAAFTNFYVQSPVCMPSRMSFLTGRYCRSLAVGANGVEFPEDDAVPVHRYLRSYGYHTTQIGKLHFQRHMGRDGRDPYECYGFDTCIIADNLAGKDNAYAKWVEGVAPDQLGLVRASVDWKTSPLYAAHGGPEFDRWVGDSYWFHNVFEADEDLTHSAFVASEMTRFLDTRSTDEPFFAIAGFFAPHAPLNPPRRFLELYDPAKMRVPILGRDETFASPVLGRLSTAEWQEIAAYYLALVSHVDDCVGTILDALERKGLSDNTIVVFTADHGEYLGDHGEVGKSMPGHDCVTRVPFLISLPGVIGAGKVVGELVEAVDVVPTLLDYCGVQTPRVVQGKSFKRLLDGAATGHRDDVLTEAFVPFGPKQTTIRTRTHKYHLSADGREILYDLAKDPHELENAVGDKAYDDVVRDLRRRMVLRLQQAAFNGRDWRPGA